MNDSLNNKELVAVGYQFAKAMSSNTPIIDMAKMVFRLAERLDCTIAALREMTKQRDALAAENAGLKAICDDRCTFIMNGVKLGYIQVPTMEADPALETIRVAVSPQAPTPATDSFQAEVRVQDMKVTLPTGWSVRAGHLINEAERGVMIPKYNGPWLSRHDVEHALRVAGISINGEG